MTSKDFPICGSLGLMGVDEVRFSHAKQCGS